MTDTTTRRVTPTAVRVLPANVERGEWLAARRHGIGSSDIPAILEVTDYRTGYHVWCDKRGEDVDTAGEAALWGRLLEDVVAREWARRNRSVIQRVGLVANVNRPWMLATLDRRVAECPLNRATREACALEVKCRSAFLAHRWRSDVPDDVLAQTTWQQVVTGYDHIHVAVLVGGNDYRQTVVRRDEQMASYVIGEVTRFREEHILADVAPPWPRDAAKAAALIELDNAMHPDRAGVVELDVQEIGEVLEYAAVSATKGRADRDLKAARAQLGRLADGHQTVTFGGELAYEFAPVRKATPDLNKLAEHWPEAYADCVQDKTHYQIRLAPAYRHSGGTS